MRRISHERMVPTMPAVINVKSSVRTPQRIPENFKRPDLNPTITAARNNTAVSNVQIMRQEFG